MVTNDLQFLKHLCKSCFGTPVVTLKPTVFSRCLHDLCPFKKKKQLSDRHITYPAWNCWSLKTGKVNDQHIPHPYWKSCSLKKQKLNDQGILSITWKFYCGHPGDLKPLSKIVPSTCWLQYGNFLLLKNNLNLFPRHWVFRSWLSNVKYQFYLRNYRIMKQKKA